MQRSPAIALLLLLVPAAIAAEPYLVLERQWLRPTGADPEYALADPDQSGTPDGTTRTVEWGYESAVSARFGVAIDRAERIELDAFVFDQSASDSVRAPAGGAVWDIFYSQGNPGGELTDASNGRAEATSDIRAWTIDLRWVHGIDFDPWRCDLSLGVRRSALRDAYSARYSVTGTAWRAGHLSDALATGLVGGLAVRRSWWDGRVGVHAEASYAVLRGTLAGESAHMVENGAFDVFEFDRTSAGFVQTDLALGGDLALGAGFTLAASYRIARWEGMVREDRFGGGSSLLNGERDTTTRDVLWDGFVVALGWAGSL
jgi:hypothetical protein